MAETKPNPFSEYSHFEKINPEHETVVDKLGQELYQKAVELITLYGADLTESIERDYVESAANIKNVTCYKITPPIMSSINQEDSYYVGLIKEISNGSAVYIYCESNNDPLKNLTPPRNLVNKHFDFIDSNGLKGRKHINNNEELQRFLEFFEQSLSDQAREIEN